MCDNNKLGIFFKRDDYLYSRMKDLRVEFQMQFFEAGIVLEVIEIFLVHQYKKFDALVGDCKCQVRVSMLLDIIEKGELNIHNLKKIEQDINELQERLMIFIDKTEPHQMIEIKNIINLINNMKIYKFFEKNNLIYNIGNDLFLIVLFFFTYLKIEEIIKLSNNFISSSRASKILHSIKKKLSLLTIEYEQNLAKQYGNIEIQKILESIVTKGFCSMTAFYPSFIPIWNKIKDKKQLVLKKTILVCDCGGVKDIQSELFRANKNKELEKIGIENSNEAAFVIEGYYFNGSFEKLSTKIDFSIGNALIQINDFKLCSCSQQIKIPVIENIEEAVLANFAQHAQFTNGAEIPWAELGLENSDLKKEYDYLRTLPGYGIHDMSKFCIVHIYASTVEQELEDQRQILLKLGKK